MLADPDGVERAQALNELALAVYRAHAALVAQGDAVVSPLGLTSARWQVLGALEHSGEPLTVPHIARGMGLTRQAIQKQVDLLKREGFVATRANPAHGRSPLVSLTGAGRAAFARAEQRWSLESIRLSGPSSPAALRSAARLLEQLTERLGR